MLNFIKLINRYRSWSLVALALSAVGFFIAQKGSDSVYFGLLLHLRMSVIYFLTALIFLWINDYYFNRRKYIHFFLLLCLTLTISTLPLATFAPPLYEDSLFYSSLNNVLCLIIVIAAAHSLRNSIRKVNRSLELNQLKTAAIEAELKLLKQQLNPHFLFNTLNSIYYHSINEPEKSPEMILQLSEMLRYQLKTDSLPKINLSEELKFIDTYIFFEKNRLRKSTAFSFKKSINFNDLLIAPNIIITLVENAFKHHRSSNQPNYVNIEILLEGETLTVKTSNSCSEKQEKSTGIGLVNLLKRLSILYDGQYKFEEYYEPNQHRAILIIKL